ncbi:MAG: hypothetical protein ACREK5_00900 [Gemmatimonadota bacterium]
MQVGKTTAADRLVAAYGFEKDALAAPIKAIATGSFGWDGRKDTRGRRLLQDLGTVGRNYDPEIWLKRLADRIAVRRPARLVVDDLRLAREAAYLKRLGFVCVRITRPPGLIPSLAEGTPGHETETEIEAVELDLEIVNGGTFDELYAGVDSLMKRLGTSTGGMAVTGSTSGPGAADTGAVADNRKAPPGGEAFGV